MSAAPGHDLPPDPYPTEAEPPLLFDTGSLLAGEQGRQMWELVLTQLEADVDEGGWDQPAQLFGVSSAATTQAILAEQGVTDLGQLLGSPPDAVSVGYAIAHLGVVGGHPVQSLWGQTAPPGTAAVVLVTEVWATPESGQGDHVGPPSTHPHRRELRSALAVTSAGATHVLQRVRGAEPEFADPVAGQYTGLLVDVLARVVGAPVTPSVFRPGHLLGRRVLTSVVTIAALADPGIALQTLPEESRPFAVALRSDLDGLDPADRREALVAVVFSGTLTAIATLVAQVVDGGNAGVAENLRTVLADGGSSADRKELAAAFADAAAATADLTWARLAGTRFGDTLPEPLASGVQWAGEDLAGLYAEHRLGATAADLLDVLGERAGERARDAVAGVLTALAWLEPTTAAAR